MAWINDTIHKLREARASGANISIPGHSGKPGRRKNSVSITQAWVFG